MSICGSQFSQVQVPFVYFRVYLAYGASSRRTFPLPNEMIRLPMMPPSPMTPSTRRIAVNGQCRFARDRIVDDMEKVHNHTTRKIYCRRIRIQFLGRGGKCPPGKEYER